jgi:hypothetical protein
MYGNIDNFNFDADDKDRTLIESGDLYPPGGKFPSTTGSGRYTDIVRGIFGNNEAEYLERERAESDAHPEIYWSKRMAKSKHCKYTIEPADTTHISKSECIELYSAVAFANACHGVALNVHVIIQWGHLGYTDHVEAASALREGFLKPLNGWYNGNIGRHGDNNGERYNDEKRRYPHKHEVKFRHELFWVYTHEVSRSGAFHTHFLAAIPIEMRQPFRLWVKNRVADLSKIHPVPKGIVKVVAPPSDPIQRQWILLQYLSKGVDRVLPANLHEFS